MKISYIGKNWNTLSLLPLASKKGEYYRKKVVHLFSIPQGGGAKRGVWRKRELRGVWTRGRRRVEKKLAGRKGTRQRSDKGVDAWR